MIEQARVVGVVTITLDEQGTVNYELSGLTREHLGLEDAIVVEAARQIHRL